MNHRIRTQMFGLIAMTLPLAACAQQPAPAAKDLAPIAANRSATPAPQLVAGLPDFTNLVEQVGPGVVNIETTITRKDAMARQQRSGPGGRGGGAMPDDDQMPEFFRRFFGPDFQMPGGPRQGPGGGDDDGGIAGKSMGSGFIISADGYVLTNHHVVDGASEVTVKLTDRREFKAKVVGSDEQYDVALLKIEAKGLPTVRLGDSNTLKPGQWVVAIGSPFGLD
ncbi:trypsin-like peptidase domain-containing protein, partial [Xanthomonas citri]